MMDHEGLPGSEATERDVLGACMLDNQLIAPICDILGPDDFQLPVHGRIWAAMRSLSEDGTAVTPLTVAPLFTDDPSLEEDGAELYIVHLLSRTMGTTGAVDAAKVVRDLALRRSLVRLADDVRARALNPAVAEPAEEIAALAVGDWERLRNTRVMAELEGSAALGKRVAAATQKVREYYPTGFDLLDKAMAGGLFPGRVYGFIGRKKTGKTILATSIAVNLDARRVKCLYVAAEMGAEQITERVLAHRMGGWSTDFYKPMLTGSERFQNQARKAAGESNDCLHIVDAPGVYFETLRRHVAAAKANGFKGIILDYLQLVRGQEKGENQVQHFDRVAQWIATAARDYGLWFVVMAQENQEGNVRGGESMRLAFDQVFRLRREDMPDHNGDGWLEMVESRYTLWADVGSERDPALQFTFGPMFVNREEVASADPETFV